MVLTVLCILSSYEDLCRFRKRFVHLIDRVLNGPRLCKILSGQMLCYVLVHSLAKFFNDPAMFCRDVYAGQQGILQGNTRLDSGSWKTRAISKLRYPGFEVE